MSKTKQDNSLFQGLDQSLKDAIDDHYFSEPREFRPLLEVLAVLGGKSDAMDGDNLLAMMKEANPAYSKLLLQQKIVCEVIEQVVMFQHGGLNNTVETMTDVLKEYNRGRDDVRNLRRSLAETQEVLTAKKSGQMSMKDLWLKKVEAEQTLKLLNDVEYLRDVSPMIHRLIQKRLYFCGVKKLNHATSVMFGDDIVSVRGLSQVRQTLMETKGHLLEDIVLELQNVIVGDNFLEKKEDNVKDEKESVDGFEDDALTNDEIDNALDQPDNIDAFQSLDLLSLTEDGEAALLDRISPEGLSLFLRYLVRAVGELQYEQDAERMILDSAKPRYLEIVRQLREKTALLHAKKMRTVNGRAAETDQARLLEMDIFAEYIRSLLDFSSKILVRLLYVLRLLSVMRKLRTGDDAPYIYSLNQTNRESVLDLWEHIELCITRQLRIHFVEHAIEDISDSVRLSKSIKATDDADAIFDQGMSSPSNVGYGVSANSFADENTPIFSSSSQFAAPVYLYVLHFTNLVKEVLASEGVLAHSETLRCQAVMHYMRDFLGTDLLPLIQLSVNSSLREIQVNSVHFTVSSAALGNEQMYAQNGALTDSRHSSLCVAARICAGAVTPLFKYWLQLPQHYEMVVTILERLILGFTGAAKEELHNCVWSLISYEDAFRKAMIPFVKDNALFVRYRTFAYEDNVSIINKSETGIVLNASSSKQMNSTVANGRPAGKGSVSLTEDSATCTKSEMLIWSPMWVLHPADDAHYPTLKVDEHGKDIGDRMISDFTRVRTCAAIIRGCDWLANELCMQCADIVKFETNQPLVFENNSLSFTDKPNHLSSKSSLHNHARDELLERTALLQHTVHNSAKDLAKLALEGLATLRAEVQASCFHFLYPLKQQRFTTDMEGLSFDGEGIVGRLGQHLFEFQKAISAALPPLAVAVVFSPLCRLMPRILMMHFISACETGYLPLQGFDCTKPFMVVVAAQKLIGAILERASLPQELLYDLQEAIGVEFEHVRRYITLLDMTPDDLSVYMKANSREYSSDEFFTIYSRACDGASRQQFDKFWHSIGSNRRERSARFEDLA